MRTPDKIKQKKILVVDDAKSIREIARAMLHDYGFDRVITVPDGHQALLKLERNDYDLVICDWVMPELNGIDLLKLMRKNSTLQQIPFLMITGSGEKEKVQEAIKAGINDFVVKPFQPHILHEKVVHLLTKLH